MASSDTFPWMADRRLVGLTQESWRRARVSAVDGGPSAVRLLAAALTRYVNDPEFRARVDGAPSVDDEALRRRRNVRLDADLWAGFAAAAGNRLYATADAALRLHLDDADG